jgi:hypothetical protein
MAGCSGTPPARSLGLAAGDRPSGRRGQSAGRIIDGSKNARMVAILPASSKVMLSMMSTW